MGEPMKNEIQLFEDQKIRVAWDAEREEWYFSIVDVVGVLTDSPDYNTGRKYWNKLKQRLKDEGNELVTNCHQLKMRAEASTTDIAKAEQPQGFDENQKVARRGGNVAGVARKALEAETGKPVVTAQNAESFRQLVTDIITDAAQLPEQTEENANGK